MEKKTIQIDRNIPKSVLIGFILAFVTVFTVQHFSTFSYIPNTGQPSIDNDGKFIVTETFYPAKTPVGALYQTTPFGTRIDLPTNGMMCSELLYDSEFKSYSNKGVLYAKSVFSDYKYFLLFWLAYTLIILFFKRYRLKVLILILPITITNCENKIVQEKTSIQSDSTAQHTQRTTNIIQPEKEQIKHAFVVFKVRDKYFDHKESVMVTGIFDTPFFINADEEYKILDNVQEQCRLQLFDKNILERFMMRFDSYAQASREKERILKINSTTYPQEQYDPALTDSVSTSVNNY
ncbi:hypothetical protein [Chryseobacterium sp. EO14]|uniref:hypothetical protein n=1 Tax=Chryseobacterium sp. EO14 TaxID=2950551 RepID=UPI00210C903B|nr:hypothetical protein [Chryseobacterium sp. EO14]MCQ4139423.1 hypothetical protein [Chryseobacterium sp. EO14]